MWFSLAYPPIWNKKVIRADILKRCVDRSQYLSKEIIQKWKSSLESVHHGSVSELWTIGFLVNIDRIFKDNKFQPKESELLLERLKILLENSVKELEKTLNIAQAEVAIDIIQEDWLFESNQFNEIIFNEIHNNILKN
jgi:hypothetical protein